VSDHGQLSISEGSRSRLLTQYRALLRKRHLTRKDVMPDTTIVLTEEIPWRPLGPKLTSILHACAAPAAYGFLLAALVVALGVVTVTTANMLPGVTALERTRTVVVVGSGLTVICLFIVFYIGLVEHGTRGSFRALARRSIRALAQRSMSLFGILGVRRSPLQALAAIWLGLAGGALAIGLEYLVLFTVRFPPSTASDTRAAAIAGVGPITGGAFLALHAAFWEEALWRGLLLLAVAAIALRWSSRRTQLATTVILLVVVSSMFGYTHQTFSTANTVTAGVSGLIYGALALHERSLWPAVIAHAVVNFAVGFIALT
jgi:membrane protease YdiL (CAAX protease family)